MAYWPYSFLRSSLCFHAYGKYPEYNYAANARHVERLFADNGLKNVDLWQGESGYPSWFPLADMWERPYEKAIDVLTKPAAHGILNGITYTPKKSYETISRLATVLSGNVTLLDGYCAGRLEGDICQALSLQLIALERNEMSMYIYYLPTDIADDQPIRNGFTLQISDFGLKNPIQEPVLIDMYTGDVLAAGSMQSEHGRRWLADLPIAEYPMLLCDRSLFETCQWYNPSSQIPCRNRPDAFIQEHNLC